MDDSKLLESSAEKFSNKTEIVKTSSKDVRTESGPEECVRTSLGMGKLYGKQHLANIMGVEIKN
jgi:hypothetical protein